MMDLGTSLSALPRLLGRSPNGGQKPSKKVLQRSRRSMTPEETRLLSLAAIQGCISWAPDLLLPIDLARLAMVAPELGVVVEEVCRHQLRAAGCLHITNDMAQFVGCHQRLHRAQRQRAIVQPGSCASENYSVAVDSYGRLFVWGRPGWLEDSGDTDAQPKGMPILLPTQACTMNAAEGRRPAPKFVTAVASRHAILALSESGQLMYAQVRRARNGRAISVDLFPLSELQSVHVTNVSTRYGQAFAVTDQGQVFAWGLPTGDPDRQDLKCSLGFGEITTCLYPKLLPSFGPGATPIRFVATGACHTIFVSVFGEVYTVGNSDWGKLGLGAKTASQKQVLEPRKVYFDVHPKPKIVSAAAGMRHSLFLASSGEVWGCGHERHGQLANLSSKVAGLSDLPKPASASSSSTWAPLRLDRLPQFCTSVAAGVASSFFVTEFGSVYFCGTACGQSEPFGRPTMHNKAQPFKIPGLKRIVEVSVSMEMTRCKWEHATFQCQDGLLYAWGHSGHGELQANITKGYCNDVVHLDSWPMPLSGS
eukprot:gb/GFBE01011655.1/.p1 GENE.gb/GFBE01011655.1/~~gb/GFBE01011655.1/.p1  ORF type:complete len:535 (+),score=79.08 gb/GFBE01011655.1/:1-1605(+)